MANYDLNMICTSEQFTTTPWRKDTYDQGKNEKGVLHMDMLVLFGASIRPLVDISLELYLKVPFQYVVTS